MTKVVSFPVSFDILNSWPFHFTVVYTFYMFLSTMMVNIPPISITSHINSLNKQIPWHMSMEIQVLALTIGIPPPLTIGSKFLKKKKKTPRGPNTLCHLWHCFRYSLSERRFLYGKRSNRNLISISH